VALDSSSPTHFVINDLGTETEQNAIKEILRRQDEYMLREVYALPEYESVRYRWYVAAARRSVPEIT
jgi:hypothetical protein